MMVTYSIQAYILDNHHTDNPHGLYTIYETNSYEDAVAVMKKCYISDRRPQLNLIEDTGEEVRKLAVKDEFGLRFDDF